MILKVNKKEEKKVEECLMFFVETLNGCRTFVAIHLVTIIISHIMAKYGLSKAERELLFKDIYTKVNEVCEKHESNDLQS